MDTGFFVGLRTFASMAQTQASDIIRCTGLHSVVATDTLAVEEPLEIRVAFDDEPLKNARPVSVTMRTPGNDTELAVGFLYTEGLIGDVSDLISCTQQSDNVVLVRLIAGARGRLKNTERNFYTTSSCGVCGKASIDAINTTCNLTPKYPYDQFCVTPQLISALPAKLAAAQTVFKQTGGIHACALCSGNGEVLRMREDVGRHNAMDKLVGSLLSAGQLPANNSILLLSGRASFELIQKAVMAGIPVVAAVGAPSSLAVQLAEEWNITLLGFVRGDRFNIYSGAQRVVI